MDCMKNRFQAGVLLDGRYETLHELNHGSFGLVFKARDVLENKFVALKCLTKSRVNPASIDEAREELAIHKQIGAHPNVVELLNTFETASHIYLVLEFCSNGDLFEAIHAERGPRQTEKVREMMLQLLDAVEHMHSRGVFHRDIKPENIFISDAGTVKLGDFGLATIESECFDQAVGSDRYMAPEQYDPPVNGYSPAKADAWAIGVCLLNILFGKNPFNIPNESDRCFNDFVFDRSSLFDVFDRMSQDTYNILIHCLALDPESRSLEAAREAVKMVDFFTTDDESTEDDFLMNSPPKAITANREPLRTPSISSPQMESGSAFPWPKALALNPPARQLSAIPDEDIFPLEAYSNKPVMPEPPVSAHTDNASIVSFVDSGLGVSLKSSTVSLEHPKFLRTEPMTISSPMSMPTRGGSLAAIFGKKKQFESKSWSDMIEDDDDFDFEFERASLSISDDGIDDVKTNNAMETGTNGFSSEGSDTPRATVADLNDTVRMITPMKSEEQLGLFDFEQHPDTGSTVTAKSGKQSTARRFLDKWQALGDRRRGFPDTSPTPEGGPVGGPVGAPEESFEDIPTPTEQESAATTDKPSAVPWNKRYRVGHWRKPRDWTVWGQGQQHWNSSATNFKEQSKLSNRASPPTEPQEWTLSTDWRRH
jgi:serine/threonine protein kinase